jgi:hypothetical protein
VPVPDTLPRRMAKAVGQRPQKSGITKWDVEMAGAQNQAASIEGRWKAARYVGCTLATALPLWMLQGIVKPIAGHTTIIQANLALGLGAGVSISLNIGQVALAWNRRRTIKRLRDEKDQHEAAVGIELGV